MYKSMCLECKSDRYGNVISLKTSDINILNKDHVFLSKAFTTPPEQTTPTKNEQELYGEKNLRIRSIAEWTFRIKVHKQQIFIGTLTLKPRFRDWSHNYLNKKKNPQVLLRLYAGIFYNPQFSKTLKTNLRKV